MSGYVRFRGTTNDFDNDFDLDEMRQVVANIGPTPPDIKPSEEQKKIIETIQLGKDVHVSAVAGSGKTTTILFYALSRPKQNILHLTYNKHLQLESVTKCRSWGIQNLDILTIHGCCWRFYTHIFSDQGIRFVLSKNEKRNVTFDYDVIFIDECQDLNMLYFHFIQKVIKDFSIKQIVLLGDAWQTIYKFKGSDERFLLLAEEVFLRPFVRLTLNQSFRITKQMAELVNVLSGCQIESTKDGKKVKYMSLDHFEMIDFIMNILKLYKPEDIFILTRSVRNDKYLKDIENSLSERKIPIFIVDDNSKINEKVIKGKLVISTYHGSKGRERDVIIMAPFGNNHYRFTHANDPKILTQELYVGLTRAKKELYLFPDWHVSKSAMPVQYMDKFMNLDCIEIDDHLKNVYVEMQAKKIIDEQSSPTYHSIRPSHFSRHLTSELTQRVMKLKEQLFIKLETKDDKDFGPEGLVESTVDNSKEQVSDITGVAIPILQLLKPNPNTNLFDAKLIADITTNILKLDAKFPPKNTEDCLKIATCIWTYNEGFNFKINQIKSYRWVSSVLAKRINQRFDTFSKNIKKYEIHIKEMIEGVMDVDCKFEGFIDGETDTHYHEYKFVESLNAEHFLQVMLYAFVILLNAQRDIIPAKKFMLINVRKNEIYETIDLNNVENANILIRGIAEIIREKIYPKEIKKKDFLYECHNPNYN